MVCVCLRLMPSVVQLRVLFALLLACAQQRRLNISRISNVYARLCLTSVETYHPLIPTASCSLRHLATARRIVSAARSRSFSFLPHSCHARMARPSSARRIPADQWAGDH